jgi:hypothetical protein
MDDPAPTADDSVAGAPAFAPRLKQELRQRLLAMAGCRRLHIVGIARSGTTMVHYAMAAFEGTVLTDLETSVWAWPTTRQALGFALSPAPARQVLVSKRPYGWYHEEELKRLTWSHDRHGAGVMLMVRDPRDVLTSTRKDSRDRFYVELDRWVASARATEWVHRRLDGRPRFLMLRYEDVVAEPDAVARRVAATFDLTLRPGIESWGALRANLERLNLKADRTVALHGVRDFDRGSVGTWRRDTEETAYVASLLNDSPQAGAIRAFMDRYGYDATATSG